MQGLVKIFRFDPAEKKNIIFIFHHFSTRMMGNGCLGNLNLF